MRRAAFVYDRVLSQHVLRQDHPFRPSRLQYTYELLDSYGAFQGPSSALVPPRPAQEAELLSFHTKDYVAAVKSLSRGRQPANPARYNINTHGDNPPYEGMYEASALGVGASLVAAELVAGGQVDVAFNIAGGLHHAAPNHASGFCFFNDAVIAINHLLNQGLRVAYIDIDAHHGDGVQDAFYSSDRVLTISLHESGQYLFPGSGDSGEAGTGAGQGYAVNLPLAPYTGDEVYLWAFREIVPPLVASFKPDLVVAQLGADAHYRDPLTHLMLTTEGYAQVIREMRHLAPRWLALGGGGYQMDVVARSWTLAYGLMIEQEWPDEIPVEYSERYGLKRLRDETGPQLDSAARDQAQRFAQKGVDEVKRLLFPRHGL